MLVDDDRRPQSIRAVRAQWRSERLSEAELLGVERHADLCVRALAVERSDLGSGRHTTSDRQLAVSCSFDQTLDAREVGRRGSVRRW